MARQAQRWAEFEADIENQCFEAAPEHQDQDLGLDHNVVHLYAQSQPLSSQSPVQPPPSYHLYDFGGDEAGNDNPAAGERRALKEHRAPSKRRFWWHIASAAAVLALFCFGKRAFEPVPATESHRLPVASSASHWVEVRSNQPGVSFGVKVQKEKLQTISHFSAAQLEKIRKFRALRHSGPRIAQSKLEPAAMNAAQALHRAGHFSGEASRNALAGCEPPPQPRASKLDLP